MVHRYSKLTKLGHFRVPISNSEIYKNLLMIQDWNIGVIRQAISDFLKPNNDPSILWLPIARRGKYLADPFGLVREGRLFILCEEFDCGTGRGTIVSFEEGKDHALSTNFAGLNPAIHMSYPYLLEHDGEVYCVPETHQAREISLYRARDFPCQWEKVGTLIREFPGADSSVFQFDGHWWLTCVNQEDGPWEKLYIWHAEQLAGPWRPHNANPVKANTHSSRPAGTPFMYQGDLYRPAQDCSDSYGKNIIINRVTKLTAEEFREEEVATIKPFKPYLDGIHTVSSVDGVSLLDGKRLRYVGSFSELRYHLARLKRLSQHRLSR